MLKRLIFVVCLSLCQFQVNADAMNDWQDAVIDLWNKLMDWFSAQVALTEQTLVSLVDIARIVVANVTAIMKPPKESESTYSDMMPSVPLTPPMTFTPSMPSKPSMPSIPTAPPMPPSGDSEPESDGWIDSFWPLLRPRPSETKDEELQKKPGTAILPHQLSMDDFDI